MPELDTIQPGVFYWCDTARSNIGSLFSDKARRPVLVVETIGEYAAVYPCSRYRNDLGASEWVGDVFGEGDTYVVYGQELFYVPLGDLQTPGIAWTEWNAWKRAYRPLLADDLRKFRARHRKRLASPAKEASPERFTRPMEPHLTEARDRFAPPKTPSAPPNAPAEKDEFTRAIEAIPPKEPRAADEDRFSVSISAHLDPELLNRLTMPPEPPAPSEPPADKPPPAPKTPPPQDEFVHAVESLPSYYILKPEEGDDSPGKPSQRRKANKKRGRR